jgi:pilus assembly protein Flp/PilA
MQAMFDKMFASLMILKGSLVERLDRDEEGATMVEYGLLVALIAVVVAVAATTLGDEIAALFEGVAGDLNP